MLTTARRTHTSAFLHDLTVLWRVARSQRRTLYAMVPLGFLSSVVESLSVSLVMLLIYRTVIGTDVVPAQGMLAGLYDWANDLASGSISRLVLVIVSAVLLRSVVAAIYGVLAEWMRNEVHHTLRQRLFTQYLQVDYEQIASQDYGVLTNTVQTEAWWVSELVGYLTRLLSNACAVAVYAVVVLAISWPVAVAAGVTGACLLALIATARRPLSSLGQQATGLHERLTEAVVSRIQALRTIRAFGAEGPEIARFGELSTAVRTVYMRLALIENLLRPAVEVVLIASIGAVILVSNAIGNAAATTITIIALLYRLQPHVREAQNDLASIFGLRGSLRAVVGALETNYRPNRPDGAEKLPEVWREIRFNRVTYTHPNCGEPTLSDVSFAIRRGAVTGLAGQSGAGKSTVVNLLLKLYAPDSGAVLVDGLSLADIQRSSWLGRITIAGQDIDLLEGSILENLNLGHAKVGEVDAYSSLDLAGIGDFVRQLPDGLETLVGERGLRLSGGQRQRIGLARAVAQKPELLILDEATNAVDSLLEAEIFDRIRTHMPDLTILVVAHRESAMAQISSVVRLENGRVAQAGPPSA